MIHDPRGVKLLTRLRLGLSRLNEYRLKHSFEKRVNPFFLCKPFCDTIKD